MSFLDRMKNRLADLATDVISPHMASDEVRAVRLAECDGCEKLFKPTMQCRACGCFVKAKTSLKDQKCPLGKW